MDFKKIFTLELVELAIRIWTAFFVFIYGAGKAVQFKDAKLIDVSIKEATSAEMMWAFFGTTREYPLIIGAIQITGAVLLIFKRTKLFGALLLTPIFINIILLDIFYKIHLGALLNAIIFQSVFVFIMIQQRKRMGKIFKTLLINQTESFEVSVIKFLLAIVLAAFLFIVYQALT